MRTDAKKPEAREANREGRPRRSLPASAFRILLRLPGTLLIGLATFYRLTLGAVLPHSCRFSPTCSEYFIQAVRKFGAVKGTALGLWRLLRCHPYCRGGHDPIP